MSDKRTRFRPIVTGALVGTLTGIIIGVSVVAPIMASWDGETDKVLVYQRGLLMFSAPIGAVAGATVAALFGSYDED